MLICPHPSPVFHISVSALPLSFIWFQSQKAGFHPWQLPSFPILKPETSPGLKSWIELPK